MRKFKIGDRIKVTYYDQPENNDVGTVCECPDKHSRWGMGKSVVWAKWDSTGDIAWIREQDAILFNDSDEIQAAIELLKARGYKIFKEM